MRYRNLRLTLTLIVVIPRDEGRCRRTPVADVTCDVGYLCAKKTHFTAALLSYIAVPAVTRKGQVKMRRLSKSIPVTT